MDSSPCSHMLIPTSSQVLKNEDMSEGEWLSRVVVGID